MEARFSHPQAAESAPEIFLTAPVRLYIIMKIPGIYHAQKSLRQRLCHGVRNGSLENRIHKKQLEDVVTGLSEYLRKSRKEILRIILEKAYKILEVEGNERITASVYPVFDRIFNGERRLCSGTGTRRSRGRWS